MSQSLRPSGAQLGTLPVFLTAISTILGAILFLRFGFAVGNTGFFGTIAIIVIGHIVTLPTALAVAEIATNIKVEGGGAYYIISRSFGLNIGAAIGIALFLSQAISVAFYLIAFVESIEPFAAYLRETRGDLAWIRFMENKRALGFSCVGLLTLLMLTKGANIGLKALYIVVAVLFTSLIFFFAGGTDLPIEEVDLFASVENPEPFFYVFTIIFPAFTGIAAGLGLSGDLKDPKKSIPKGTLWATIAGIVVYIAVALKLVLSVPLEDLANNQLIMSEIAIWGPIIPIGLACAAISSALGSVMVAPRTLQALGLDGIFPIKGLNRWTAKGKKKDNEPVNGSIITCLIAFIFVAAGDINSVAEVISMFFMVTYGAICTISFLEHFSADPSYRPTFRSHWALSLLGAVSALWLMFKMNAPYAFLSLALMGVIYLYISKYNSDKGGLVKLFRGVLFQLNRRLQVYVQKKDYSNPNVYWRPFAVVISDHTFKRRDAFDLLRWWSLKYGFGTYIHYVKGYLSAETHVETQDVMRRLLHLAEGNKSRVVMDTIVSPSYTSALAQVIQLNGISGKGHNLILFDYQRDIPEEVNQIAENYGMLKATEFDVAILSTNYRGFGRREKIHLWVGFRDYDNATLMILLAYILLGHPDWKGGEIEIYTLYEPGQRNETADRLQQNIREGKLPVSPANVRLIEKDGDRPIKSFINEHSAKADLTMIGYQSRQLMNLRAQIFDGYDDLGNVLFVNSLLEKDLD